MQKYEHWTRDKNLLNISEAHQLTGWDYDRYEIANLNLNLNYCEVSNKLSRNFISLIDFSKIKEMSDFIGGRPSKKTFKKLKLFFIDLNDNKFHIFFIDKNDILLYVEQQNLNLKYDVTIEKNFTSFKELINYKPIKNCLKKENLIKFLTDKIKGL